MITLLIQLLVACLVFGLLWYALSFIPLPPPLRIAVNVIFCLLAIFVLLGLVGWIPGMRFGHLDYGR